MEQYETIKSNLIKLHYEFSNDILFGEHVRTLVWKIMKEQSKQVEDTNITAQINVFGEIKND